MVADILINYLKELQHCILSWTLTIIPILMLMFGLFSICFHASCIAAILTAVALLNPPPASDHCWQARNARTLRTVVSDEATIRVEGMGGSTGIHNGGLEVYNKVFVS